MINVIDISEENDTEIESSLSLETRQLLQNMSQNNDLHLPSIYSYLPHLLKNPAAISPAFKLSKGRHSGRFC